MGFWSGVCSFVGSVCSGISSAVRSVGRAVISGVSKAVGAVCSAVAGAVAGVLGSAVMKGIGALVTGSLGPVLGMVVGNLVIQFIAAAVRKLAASEQVLDEKEKPEEVGARLEEAANHPEWKKREDFEDYSEYYEYLKLQIPDEQLATKDLDRDRNKYLSIYTAAISTELSKKMGIEITDEFLLTAGRARMKDEEIKQYITAFKTAGLNGMAMKDFFTGKLSRDVHDRILESLIEAKQGANNGLSKLAIKQRNLEIREAFLEDEKVYKNYKPQTDSVIQEIETNKNYTKSFGYGKEFDDRMAEEFRKVQSEL